MSKSNAKADNQYLICCVFAKGFTLKIGPMTEEKMKGPITSQPTGNTSPGFYSDPLLCLCATSYYLLSAPVQNIYR